MVVKIQLVQTGARTVFAHVNALRAKVPGLQKAAVETLLKKGIDIARSVIEEKDLVFTKNLWNSYKTTLKTRGQNVTSGFIGNTAPYFESIEEGKPDDDVWVDDLTTLNEWRAHKGIPESEKAFVEVGKSKGGVPYPRGAHSLEEAYKELLGLTEQEFDKRIKQFLS